MSTTTEISYHRAVLTDVRMHYMRAGSGSPVVLLHGWPQSSEAWRDVIGPLAERHTVIAPDMRGFGASSKPESGYDGNTVAADIRELTQQLGLGPFHLVGHDWGGAIAYSYASQFPEDVTTLSVFDMLVPGFALAEESLVPRGDDYLWLWHMGFQAVPDIPEALIAGREDIYLDYFFRTYSYDGNAVAPERMRKYVDAMRGIGALRAGLQYYSSSFVTAEQNKKHLETKLAMPVLAMGGEAALQDLVQQTFEIAASNVRGGIIPRCGHWIGEENPTFISGQLLEFFATA